MEDVIIGLLFLYVFVLRPILKQVRKGTPQPLDRADRPRSLLRDVFEHLKAQVREAAERAEAAPRGQAGGGTESARRGDVWATPAGDMEESFWNAETAVRPWDERFVGGPTDPNGHDPAASSATWGEPVSAPAPQARPAVAVPPVVPTATRFSPAAVTARRPTHAGVDLRKAVVWSELLGPPVSLRDPD